MIIPRNTLIKALETVRHSADPKARMPVLGSVLLEVDAGTLALACTDLYVYTKTSPLWCDVNESTRASLAVPVKDLLDRVKRMPDGPITLTLPLTDAPVTLGIETPGRKYVLRGTPGADYPPIQTSGTAPVLELPAADLYRALGRVEHAISTDETRPPLNSLLVEVSDDCMRLVSTDGHRLAKQDVSVPGKRKDTSFLIPRRAMLEILRACKGASGTAVIATSKTFATITIGDTIIVAKLVDAQFPPYEQVIPSRCDYSATVQSKTLREAVDAVLVAASARTGKICFRCRAPFDVVSLEASAPDKGEASAVLECTGACVDLLALNGEYVKDVLACIPGTIVFDTTTPLVPCVFRDPTDPGFVAVVMPMRV